MKILDKLNIGSKNKKSFFDFRHDVNTTSQFGFCQPTLIQSVQPKSSLTLKTNSFVRLGVLPQPTFGRIKVKTDTVYVPMSEVYEAFDYMKNGQSYSTSNFSGIPESADFILAGQLFNNMLLMSQTKSDNNPNAYTMSQLRELFSQFFVCDVEINYDPFIGQTDYKYYKASRGEFRSLSQMWNALDTTTEKYRFMIYVYHLIYDALPVTLNTDIPSDFRPILANKLGITNSNALSSSILHVQRGIHSAQDVINLFGMFVTPDMARYVAEFANEEDISIFIDNTSEDFYNFCLELAKLPSSFDSAFIPLRSSENADFLIQYVPRYYMRSLSLSDSDITDFNTFLSPVELPENTELYQSVMTRISFHLTPFGKNVMKILTAGEITFGNFNSMIELTKLFAYYKAWFDLYNPGRNKNWKFTSCYKLIHYFYDYNKNMATINGTSTANLTSVERDIRYHFRLFLTDLAMCYYYIDVDQFTVCTPTVLQSSSPSLGNGVLFGIGARSFPVYSDGDSLTTSFFDPSKGYTYTSDTDELSSFSVKMLERLYYMANKESVLASKIEDIMRVKYGVNIRTSRILGRDSFDCDISEVIASVNNDQTALGEYAGKGVGSSSTKEIKFEIGDNGQGYIIQLMSIVPLGGYVQGMKPAQLTRYDFFTEELDSLGMEAVGKDEILSRESLINVFRSQNQTFGFRPRYFGLKYKNNVNNGGFAFRSERSQFLPYCLDRIFSEGNIDEDINSRGSVTGVNVGFPDYKINQPVDVVPDEILRSLGLVQAYGNYDRIFNDQTGFIDNFIVHIVQDFKYYAPMKPISDSWDTFDEEVDDSSKSANHE